MKNSMEIPSVESIGSEADSELNPEECTSLLNTTKQNMEGKFTVIELQVLKEDKEISPGDVPCGRLEKHDSDNMECRICRCKDDEPLISPCKCSGSSKWIHQSCLIQWFQVSRATRCELCSEKVFVVRYTKPVREVRRLIW